MPGPIAKDPSIRTRRNKTSTRATLVKKAAPAKPPAEPAATAEQAVERKTPTLPDSIEWYPSVTEWWDDLWTSEPRDQWIDADVHLLFVAARIYQAMLDPATKVTAAKALAGEFRQIMVQFGLTPMSRRTLQWEITSPEKTSGTTPPAKRTAPKAADPRAKFRVVAGGA
ncbi:phage terminase small subunit [Mycolicibacterium fluoranthenivorans]|uniref:Terminase small subunit n=1 Tax=Mycolicibacterium fluoranthenivorans TaxID=258505 RepID=A0A7X5U5P4_9MYCO|nr:hypothetical protein [Mycolicibacterium fluoranthenivorans]MCV7354484.1 hypothetical protein [Mycolicibacterium fluoranthenivorans]NIH98911.1 hypothetical protein [Mycolicibacterium fluoranthenivorans]